MKSGVRGGLLEIGSEAEFPGDAVDVEDDGFLLHFETVDLDALAGFECEVELVTLLDGLVVHDGESPLGGAGETLAADFVREQRLSNDHGFVRFGGRWNEPL